MSIAPPPIIPQITDPTTFANRAQDWVVWQSTELYPFIIDYSQLLLLGTTSQSLTSNEITLGEKTFIVEANKGYVIGMSVTIASALSPANRMAGLVLSYTGTTLLVDILSISGTGTFDNWVISLAVSGVGGGAVGGGSDAVFYLNSQMITADYNIPEGQNAMTAGEITIADGVLVTVPDGSTWTIV